MTTTSINYKSVGRGRWSLESAKKYCEKKKIELKSLRHCYHEYCGPYYYDIIDLETGFVIAETKSDPIRAMLGL